jgi:hypothetical protein
MTNISRSVVPAIVASYDFSGFEKLVDIAGGHGLLLAGILKANPNLQGVLFDLPYVIENAYEGFELQGVVETVLSRGNVVIENGEYIGKQGDGQFIKRGTCVKI